MNILMSFAYSASSKNELYSDLATSYGFLALAIPIMIAFMLIMMFMMIVGILGVSDRLNEIRHLLENVFEEKLEAVDERNRILKESEKAAKLAAREERQKSIKPPSRSHRITMNILLASIPVLLIILIVLSL